MFKHAIVSKPIFNRLPFYHKWFLNLVHSCTILILTFTCKRQSHRTHCFAATFAGQFRHEPHSTGVLIHSWIVKLEQDKNETTSTKHQFYKNTILIWNEQKGRKYPLGMVESREGKSRRRIKVNKIQKGKKKYKS